MTTPNTERLLDQIDAARNAQAMTAYTEWLAGLKVGDEVAVYGHGGSVAIERVDCIEFGRIEVTSGGEANGDWYNATTGRDEFGPYIAQPTPEARRQARAYAVASHARRAYYSLQAGDSAETAINRIMIVMWELIERFPND